MSEQIIVGYDGTTSSAEAVLWAAHESVCRNVELNVISCYEIPVAGEAMYGWASTEPATHLADRTEVNLAVIRELVLRERPTVKLRTVAAAGPATLTLHGLLTPSDLVVVGASSHQGRAAFWLGSTPRWLIRHSPCPVIVVRSAVSRGRPDRIVVGVDGSEACDDALVWAANEAQLHQSPLIVVHGWWYPYFVAEDSRSQARDLTRVDAACVLDAAVERARDVCGLEVTGQLVESGPASALLDTVCDGDLLVVGSHGRGAIATGVIGSTAHSIVERSVVPVVVVR